jgi:hypothetical protein
MVFIYSTILVCVSFVLSGEPLSALPPYAVSLLTTVATAQGVVLLFRVIVGPLFLGTPSHASRFLLDLDDATKALDEALHACAYTVESGLTERLSATETMASVEVAKVLHLRFANVWTKVDSLLKRAGLLRLDCRIRLRPIRGHRVAALARAVHNVLQSSQDLEISVMQLIVIALRGKPESGPLAMEPAPSIQRLIRDARLNLRSARTAALSAAKKSIRARIRDLEKNDVAPDEEEGPTVSRREVVATIDDLEKTAVQSLRNNRYAQTSRPEDVIVTAFVLSIASAGSFVSSAVYAVAQQALLFAAGKENDDQVGYGIWEAMDAAVTGAGGSSELYCGPGTNATIARDHGKEGAGHAAFEGFDGLHDTENAYREMAFGSDIAADSPEAPVAGTESGDVKDYVIGGADRNSRLVKAANVVALESTRTVSRAGKS